MKRFLDLIIALDMQRYFGNGPSLKGSTIRQRLLGSDRARFRVEAAQGAVGTFERVVE